MIKRLWWKLYFLVALVLMVLTAIAPLFVEPTEVQWWTWSDIPLYLVQLIALFGLAFWRRIGASRLWQLIFIATLAYEG